MKIIYQLCRAVAAIILVQTLFFKFTGAEESVYIFTKVGAEPFGRIGSGIVELIAAILLFVPRLTWLGATLACGVMAGAIMSHLTILGIDVLGDGGLLFSLACIVFACSLFVLWVKKSDLPILGPMISPKLG
jgi:putative oxidoreductase